MSGARHRAVPTSRSLVVAAGRLLVAPGQWLEGGGFVVRGGRVQRLLANRAAVRRARSSLGHGLELGESLVTPGLVNAHAHLELGGFEGELPRRGSFRAWIERLLELRAGRGPAQLARDAELGLRRSLAAGTTSVGDIASTDATLAALAAPGGYGGRGPRVRIHREVLDVGRKERTAEALRRVARGWPARARRYEGLSPHAPYTCSLELLVRARRLAERRSLPVAVHWAETAEEVRWLATGRGAFGAILGNSPLRAGSTLLEEAGLLRPGTALIHGNHPEPGDPARLAAAGVTLVHCPGCHDFFGRPPFPWARYRRAGVRLALGTDSLARNDDLDLRREWALARRAAPGLAPDEVWAMATVNAAEALGFAGRAGTLAPGAWADFLAHAVDGPTSSRSSRAELMDRLTGAQLELEAVWLGGRRASS